MSNDHTRSIASTRKQLEHFSRHLARRGGVAVLLLVVIIVSTGWVMNRSLNIQAHTSNLMTVATRQHMVYQRLSDNAHELVSRVQNNSTTPSWLRVHQRSLDADLRLLRDSQKLISDATPSLALPWLTTPDLKPYYEHSPDALNHQLGRFSHWVSDLANADIAELTRK